MREELRLALLDAMERAAHEGQSGKAVDWRRILRDAEDETQAKASFRPEGPYVRQA